MTSLISRASETAAGKANASSGAAPAAGRSVLAERARLLRSNALPMFGADNFVAIREAPTGPTYVPPYGRVAPRDGLRRAQPSKERDAAVQACVDKIMKRIDALPAAERVRAKVGPLTVMLRRISALLGSRVAMVEKIRLKMRHAGCVASSRPSDWQPDGVLGWHRP